MWRGGTRGGGRSGRARGAWRGLRSPQSPCVRGTPRTAPAAHHPLFARGRPRLCACSWPGSGGVEGGAGGKVWRPESPQRLAPSGRTLTDRICTDPCTSIPRARVTASGWLVVVPKAFLALRAFLQRYFLVGDAAYTGGKAVGWGVSVVLVAHLLSVLLAGLAAGLRWRWTFLMAFAFAALSGFFALAPGSRGCVAAAHRARRALRDHAAVLEEARFALRLNQVRPVARPFLAPDSGLTPTSPRPSSAIPGPHAGPGVRGGQPHRRRPGASRPPTSRNVRSARG